MFIKNNFEICDINKSRNLRRKYWHRLTKMIWLLFIIIINVFYNFSDSTILNIKPIFGLVTDERQGFFFILPFRSHNIRLDFLNIHF
jgi:hypothetical protein